MDTEGMTPHPIFEALSLVNDEVFKAVYMERRHPTGPSVAGWDLAFEDMEDDDALKQAFAVTLGFADATEYHAETDWCDRNGLQVDWYEQTDLRP